MSEATSPLSSASVSDSEASKNRLPILMIFFTVLIDMIGFGIVIPVLPLYALKFQATPVQIGMLFGSFSLMQLIFAPLLGRLSDRFGRRPVLLVSILGTALGFLTLGMAGALWMLFLGRLIDGMSGGNISTAQAYIADVTPIEKRSGAMGLIGAAFGLGFVIGPAIGGWLGHSSLHLPFLVAAGLALLNSIGLFFFLPESLPPEKRASHQSPSLSMGEALALIQRLSLMPLLSCLLFGTMAFALVTALFTLFSTQRLHWNTWENGNLFAYMGLLGVIVQGGLLRRLSPKVGEKPLIIFGSILLCLSMALLPLPIGGFWTVILAVTGLAIGNSLVTPLVSSLASKSADAQSQGVVLGITQSVASLARLLGPSLGGYLLAMDAAHPNIPYAITPFGAAAILMALGVVAALQLHKPASTAPA
jgi:multidrug resistance protein